MNLQRRFSILFVFACLLALSASAANADPRTVQSITVSYPQDGSTVTYPFMTFSWSHSYSSSTYRLTVRSTDGQQKIVIPVNGGTCLYLSCSTGIYPATGWKWRENTVYEWQVKGFDANGELNAKSTKRTFVTDMIHPINLISPNYATNIAQISVNFSWAPDYSVGEYRLVITRPDGVKVKSAWMTVNSICSQTCTYSFSFLEYSGGAYQWHVEGRHSQVIGKSKSMKMALSVVG